MKIDFQAMIEDERKRKAKQKKITEATRAGWKRYRYRRRTGWGR